jgi:hypothetical protein
LGVCFREFYGYKTGSGVLADIGNGFLENEVTALPFFGVDKRVGVEVFGNKFTPSDFPPPNKEELPLFPK